MPISLRYLTLPLLLVATPVVAQSAFDGTWKGELASATIVAKPDSFRIKDGVYSCATCIPPYSVPADGAYHAVKGKDYWDDIAITVVDDHTVKYSYRKGGKIISDNVATVAADGNTLAMTAHNTNNGGGVPIDSTSSQTRVGAPVPGAHLISGEWQAKPASSLSDAALTMTMAISGGMLHLKTGLGETLDARIGGPYAINAGDPGKTMTKVARPDANTLVLTDMRSGKISQVSTYTIGADGKLKGSWKEPQSGASGSFTATRQ